MAREEGRGKGGGGPVIAKFCLEKKTQVSSEVRLVTSGPKYIHITSWPKEKKKEKGNKLTKIFLFFLHPEM